VLGRRGGSTAAGWQGGSARPPFKKFVAEAAQSPVAVGSQGSLRLMGGSMAMAGAAFPTLMPMTVLDDQSRHLLGAQA
jgi:hypothetical protein